MVQPALKEFDDVVVVQADEHIASPLAGADDAFVAQSAQLVRDGGFGQSQPRDEFADAHLPIHERADDAHARGVAEGLEEAGEAGGGIGRDEFIRHGNGRSVFV